MLLLLLVQLLPAALGLQNVIRIGGLFTPDSPTADQKNPQEMAFRYAAEMINADPNILSNHTLMTQIEQVPEVDCFQVARTVCKMLGVGVTGIFGPPSGDASDHVQSMCDTMDMPHIETRPDVRQRRQDLMVNIYPHPPTLAKAFADLVKAWGWKSFTVIYEDGEGLVRLSKLIKFYPSKGYTVTVRQLDPLSSNYRPVLRTIRDSGDKNIVLDCSLQELPEVLRQAQQVGLMIADYSYIITNLDMHTINMEPYQWSGTNITGVRLVDPQAHDVQLTVRWWSDREMRSRKSLHFNPDTLLLSTALIHDAVYVFAKALARLDSPTVETAALDCNTDDTWSHGSSLINFMKDSGHRGLTGLIQFDNEGFRSSFELDIVEMGLDGLQKVGTWNSTEGLNLTRAPPDHDLGEKDLHNMTFVILTALAKPYGMLKEDTEQLTGNARFEGFGIELMHEISLLLGFNYTLEIQEDGKNGAFNTTTNEWDGMVRALIDKKADLAIVDLTITAERESAVDFTMPFMNLGISILYKKPTAGETPPLFSFLTTFSPGVWYYMLGAYTGVSIVMFITGRISPKEWTNPYPCIQDPDELENQFNLKNAFWFTIGSLMQQGSEIAPIAISTRMVAGIWWFFTLIMVSSYTANLAAVLTLESMSIPFKNVEELANNKQGIMYGAKMGGSTANFFRDSNYPTYLKMWKFMESHPEVWTDSNDQGIEWVKTKKYAYFMESSSIEYIVERDCNVVQIGGMLDNKGYGIAMRKNSTYRNKFSTAVLKLQESGKLAKMKNRWWQEERGGGACVASSSGGTATQLSLGHVGGVFVVLVSGVTLAIVFTLIELIYEVSTIAYKEKIPFYKLMMEELRFVARCRGSTKPVRKCTTSDDGDDPHRDGNEDFGQVSLYNSGFKQRLT